MNRSYTRFAPSLEMLDARLNLSAVTPTASIAVPEPRPEPMVTLEYLLVAAVPEESRSRMFAIVDRTPSRGTPDREITMKGSHILQNAPVATGGTETITVDGTRTR